MGQGRRLCSALGAVASLFALFAPATAVADPVPLSQYGLGTAGGAAGQLHDPTGIAVDANGSVYVSEYTNARVSIFNADGTFARAFGWDVIPGGPAGLEVCTTATGCKAGVSGDSAGQFGAPQGITVDGSGRIYVADGFDNRVAVFNADATFVSAFGKDVIPGGSAGFEVCTTDSGCQTGASGGGAGEFFAPGDVEVAPAGEIYVADNGNQRIAVFTSQPVFLRAFGFDVDPDVAGGFQVCTTATGCKAGVSGPGAGQLNNPGTIDLDGAGNLYVSEFNNRRVSVFGPQPAFLRAFGADVIPGGSTGFEVCTISCQGGAAAGGGPGQLTDPEGVDVAADGTVRVAEFNGSRVSTFTAVPSFVNAFGFDVLTTGGTGFEVCTTSCKAALPGNGVGQLNHAVDVATDCRGAIYVAEQTNQRVQRFGEPGTALPPCPPPQNPPPNPPANPPPNDFTIGKLKRNMKKGTAKLPVELPSAGTVELSSKKAKPQKRDATAAGELVLKVVARGKAKEKLADTGAVKVKLAITFTPTGGASNTETTTAKLKRKGR